MRKLAAAHSLTIGADGVVHETEYWNPLRDTTPETKMAPGATEAQWTEKIGALLKNSIDMQMISDVPFGCFLSGGIDSSRTRR